MPTGATPQERDPEEVARLTPEFLLRREFSSIGLSASAEAEVATSQGTAILVFTDLATAGPSVTITVGSSGIAVVMFQATVSNNIDPDGGLIGVRVDAIDPVDNDAIGITNGGAGSMPIAVAGFYYATGLAGGSHTFKLRYRAVTGGTATFSKRKILAIPL